MNTYTALHSPMGACSGEHERIEQRSLLEHDLRAALCEIRGGLQMIPEADLSPVSRKQIERIQAASDFLSHLIERGIGASDAPGKHRRAPEPLWLARFADMLERRWAPAAQASDRQLQIAISESVPSVFQIDALKVERILSNLLSNALSYAAQGQITVTIEMADPSTLRIRVCDEGPGFSEAFLTHAGTAGWRDTALRPKEGKGLGLFICKTLTQSLGGALTLSNRAEGGAQIALELPVLPKTAPVPREPCTLPDLSGARVLVADDSQTNQFVLAAMLGALGASPMIYADGTSARAALLAQSVDLVIVDIEMPGASGLEVIKCLRASGVPWADCPVIACTGHVQGPNLDAIRTAGAGALLAKPLEGLMALSRRICEAVQAAPPHLNPCKEVVPGLSLECTKWDSALAQHVIADLRAIHDGLRAAQDPLDRDAIRTQCHMLSAVAGTAGDMCLTRHARALNCSNQHGPVQDIADLTRETLDRVTRLIHQLERHFSTNEFYSL
ncbi:Response regulator receiver domain-containing protein [Thioclava dalianensis]|nr:ATP-binding protein [Thioclava dalianensis]SFM83521.1 Response regulator receiver domain-containing protein [Thioclava dalianensis]